MRRVCSYHLILVENVDGRIQDLEDAAVPLHQVQLPHENGHVDRAESIITCSSKMILWQYDI
jgi:hypothetical protein